MAATATAAGGSSSDSTSSELEVDTTPLTAPGIPDLIATSDSGPSDTDDYTNDVTPSFTIACAEGATVELLSSAAVVDSGVCVGGTVTLTLTAQTDGVYSLSSRQTDRFGTTASSAGSLSVTVDTAAPAAPVVTAISEDRGTANDQLTSDNTLVFSGTAEANSVVSIILDGNTLGTTITDGSGNWSYAHSGSTHA